MRVVARTVSIFGVAPYLFTGTLSQASDASIFSTSVSVSTQSPSTTENTSATSISPSLSAEVASGSTTTNAASSTIVTASIALTPPPLIVPDTSGAPFMQKSTLPEGFVFICVGAILGFLGLAVLAWRGVVAWTLHRTVRKSASTRYMSERKLASSTKYSGGSGLHSTSISLEDVPFEGAGYARTSTNEQHRRSTNTTHHMSSQRRTSASNSLYYSPTAGGVPNKTTSRTSTFLPPGYYASGASNVGNGAQASAYSASNVPSSAGYAQSPTTNYPNRTHARKSTSEAHVREGRRSGASREARSRISPAALDDPFQSNHTSRRS